MVYQGVTYEEVLVLREANPLPEFEDKVEIEEEVKNKQLKQNI